MRVLLLLSAIFLLLNSCQDNVTQPTDEGGPGIIVPGKSIEGVKLGDSRESVEQKLGSPTAVGWADGLYRSWRSYTYLEKPYAILFVDFIDYDSIYGPVDKIGAISPYSGKTKEGIGIGSPYQLVHQIYGEPNNTVLQPEKSRIADFYCFSGKKFEVHYVDSIVTTISIGYFIPIKEDTLTSCD